MFSILFNEFNSPDFINDFVSTIDSQDKNYKYRKPNIKWNGNNFVGEGPYLTIKNLLQSTNDCNREGSGGFKQV